MKYDLVFEGGGAKGMVFVGAMQEFETRGHTFGRLLGTSAGAITAALLAAGYSAAEMLAALGEQQDGRSVFAGFLATPEPFDPPVIQASATRAFLRRVNSALIPDFIEERLEDQIVAWMAAQPTLRCVFSFIENGGWYAADHFIAWMQTRLDSGSYQGQPRCFSQHTLEEFYQRTQVDLSLVASDTTGGNMLVLNHRTAPQLPLVYAVRMSMSIPLLWQEVVWREEWGPYRGQDIHGHAIVDGGLLSNFPIELFLSDEPPVTAVMGPAESENVIGMLIDESLPLGAPAMEARSATASNRISMGDLQTVRRLSNLVNTMTSARDKMVIESFEDRVARLPAQGYGTTEFDMDGAKRNRLVQAGRDTIKLFFARQPEAGLGLGSDLEQLAEAQKARQTANRLARKILKN